MVWVEAEVWSFADAYRIVEHDIYCLVAQEIVEVLVGIFVLFLLVGVSDLALNNKLAYQIIDSEFDGVVIPLLQSCCKFLVIFLSQIFFLPLL